MKPAQAPRRSLLPLLVLAVLAGLVIGAVWWATRPGPLLILIVALAFVSIGVYVWSRPE